MAGDVFAIIKYIEIQNADKIDLVETGVVLACAQLLNINTALMPAL
jgi:hypothetical protein